MGSGNKISVGVYGTKKFHALITRQVNESEADDFDIYCHLTDDNLEHDLRSESPDVILTIGNINQFKKLHNSSYEICRRWIHKDTVNTLIGDEILYCYLTNTLKRNKRNELISVFTPTYKTGYRIQRPYQSLLKQKYKNWEWVIVDDSDDEETWKMLKSIADKEPRISLYKSAYNSGNIGEMKYRACMLSKGEIVVELDHDDELTKDALFYVTDAFEKFPESGFAYSDCAEVFEKGGNAFYNNGWGFGYGSYRKEVYEGRELLVSNYPPINAKTVRHIIGMPNHFRAWKKDFYFSIGGHNRDIHVCDDYELMIRTFLNTKIIKIPKLGYIQYYNTSGNTQKSRNKEIQRLVRCFREHYDKEIHERLIELGVDDFVWDEEINCCDLRKQSVFGQDCNLIYS